MTAGATTGPWQPSPLQLERDAYRRRRTTRSVLISAASTALLGTVLVVAVTNAPGWPRTRDTFFDLGVGWDALPEVARGFWLNLRVFAVSAVAMLVIGLGLALLRTLRGPVFWPLRALATAYIDLFRGVPQILVLLLVGFGVPGLRLEGVPSSVFVLGCASLVLTYSAYVAEVFRAGIESVHPSQRAAARSLGLSGPQAMRHVVLPQAVRRVTPPLLNDVVSLSKDSSLISVLGAIDAVRSAQIVTAQTFDFTPYVVASVLFVLLTIPLTRITDAVARRTGHTPREATCERTDVTVSEPLLRVQNLRKSYGRNVVLDGLDLDVDPHRVTVLIGASGSGKSTLLRCVDLLEVVDDGVVELEGEDITDPRVDADAVRARMGIVFQAFNLFPHLSVLDNITLAPVKVHGVAREAARERALAMLDRVGLKDRAGAHPDELSGGQQQRVAIARALVNDPVLMLFDEVTSALDPGLVGEVLAMLRDLKGEGMTMVIATHEMGFARQVADEVCFLDGGRVLERGPAAQVLGDPQQERTRRFLRRIVEAGRL